MSRTLIESNGADLISGVAAMSSEARRAFLDDAFERMNTAHGDIVAAVGEVDRGQEYRDEGATSTESWLVERYGISTATARTLAHVGEKAWDMPHLIGSLSTGALSFDKMRVLADVATPESEGELCERAQECSVRELADIARSRAELARTPPPSRTGTEHDGRFVRFNDGHRSISAQLPADAYAEVKAGIDAQLGQIPSNGQTPLDQRRCDAFLGIIRSSLPDSAGSPTTTGTTSPYVVVAHVPLSALVEDGGQTSTLAGELEGHGLVDGETVRRLACDATLVVALDDALGHTMYEGRARRFPSEAQRREIMRRDRQCRFPGCTNVTFTNVHHIVPWKPRGRTDLKNLVLTCLYHHHLVHSRGWTVSGNANEELTFSGPTGRVMTSLPSPLWTRVTARPRSGPSG
jgi:Domain of unknown function (DUF222)/HNH endonuclease